MRETLGKDLKNERIGNKLTQADVAGKMGCYPQYVSDVENGRKNPTVDQIKKHLHACNSSKKIRVQ